MFDTTSDNYWACWSDKTSSGIEPGLVYGTLGFAEP
jgi:hypothetical protein